MADPKWNNDGEAVNLEAAAADAGVWLEMMERFVINGTWRFSLPDTLERLRACRNSLASLSLYAADGGNQNG